MYKLYLLVVLVVAVISFASSDKQNPIVQCQGEDYDDLQNRIQITPCGTRQCKLRKGTNITVTFRFNPKNEVLKLTNQVHANIAGIPLPFIGVTGTTACGHIIHAEDDTPASCPLKAGVEYKYVNVFPIEEVYPQLNIVVHWELNDGKKNVICFEVPAVITAGSKN